MLLKEKIVCQVTRTCLCSRLKTGAYFCFTPLLGSPRVPRNRRKNKPQEPTNIHGVLPKPFLSPEERLPALGRFRTFDGRTKSRGFLFERKDSKAHEAHLPFLSHVLAESLGGREENKEHRPCDFFGGLEPFQFQTDSKRKEFCVRFPQDIFEWVLFVLICAYKCCQWFLLSVQAVTPGRS